METQMAFSCSFYDTLGVHIRAEKHSSCRVMVHWFGITHFWTWWPFFQLSDRHVCMFGECVCDKFEWKQLFLFLSLSVTCPLFLYQRVLGKCQAPVFFKESITFQFWERRPFSPIVLVTVWARSDVLSSKVDLWFTHAVKQGKSLQ